MDTPTPIRSHLRYDVSVVATPGATVVIVRGEIDLLAERQLGTVLTGAIDCSDAVLVDLCACTFIDSAGLAALLAAARRAKVRGVPLAASCPPGSAPRGLFDLVLGHGFFTACDDREAGLAALRAIRVDV